MRPRPFLRFVFALLVLLLSRAAEADSAESYLRFVPLSYPRLVRETDASRALRLFGDEASPDYRDEAPRDGIDDARAAKLQALAVRFAPYMVRNTTLFPMDFRRMMELQHSSRLSVDRWNVAVSPKRLVKRMTLDLSATAQAPCPQGPSDDTRAVMVDAIQRTLPLDDCELLALLEDFNPEHPADPYVSSLQTRPDDLGFKVLYFDFPGATPEEWKAEYRNPLSNEMPGKYRGIAKSYVHPFVAPAPNAAEGYEFVLQYWFFYPTNDAGNKHEGDWEHLNVVVTPLSKVGRPLSAADVEALLARGTDQLDGPDPLVIGRLDYYLHDAVMPLDFGSPNVYLPRAEWDLARRKHKQERVGERAMEEALRYRAWMDAAETVPNTHPVVFIAGNSKGLDLLLYPPGARNQDSHASYPFPGTYKNVGPANYSEVIVKHFDHRKYAGRPPPDEVVPLDDTARLEVVPDWERLLPLVQRDPAARQHWAWLLLPIRWGFPATSSPFAGIIAHAETGNLSPVTPSFSSGWNNAGPSGGFALYDPQRFFELFPVSPLDVLQNKFGYLNIPLVALVTLPPFDVLLKLGVAPAAHLFTGTDPVFYPTTRIPFRFLSFGVGASRIVFEDDWALLFFNRKQGPEILRRAQASGTPVDSVAKVSDATAWLFQLAFHLSPRFSTENSFRFSTSDSGFDVLLANRTDVFRTRGRMSFYEWAGALRFNLLTGGFEPYLKLGYGLSWYKLESAATDGVPLTTPTSDTFRRPSLVPFDNVFPNTWHFGIGLEFLPVMSIGPLPGGLDFSIKGEFALYSHSLGLSFEDIQVVNLGQIDPTIWRPVFDLLAVVSF